MLAHGMGVMPMLAVLLALICFSGPVGARPAWFADHAAWREASSASYCCFVLRLRLHDQVIHLALDSYVDARTLYWSQQEASLSLSCIVRPRNARDVSTAVWILGSMSRLGSYFGSESGCPFAIRGGGHSPVVGSANMEGGVTIDLSAMKDVSVRADRSVVSVGAGSKWRDVYLQLDPMGLTVTGGRVTTVGAAGLTLGGGLSFFSSRRGLACDNVEKYEIVLASGAIVNANEGENADLWLALRGGSNNFGVVTRFDLETFDQGPFWGGLVAYQISSRHQQFDAIERYSEAVETDPYASLVSNYAYTEDVGWLVANNLHYTKPEPNADVLRSFMHIQPRIFSTMRLSNMTDFTNEIAQQDPSHMRFVVSSLRLFVTSTFSTRSTLLHEMFELSNATLQTLLPCHGLVWALTYQPFSSAAFSRSGLNGGGASGGRNGDDYSGGDDGGSVLEIDPSGAPLTVLLLSVYWLDAADDEHIEAALKDFTRRADDAARRMNLGRSWVYLSYAAPWQDALGSYGAANKARLQRVSRRYDPRGVFQKNVPGGFKLFG